MISFIRRKISNMFEKLWRIKIMLSIRNSSFQCVNHSESLRTKFLISVRDRSYQQICISNQLICISSEQER